jgi:hypothetical protein
VNVRNQEPSDNITAKVGKRLHVDFIEGIGDPNANGGVRSMLFSMP